MKAWRITPRDGLVLSDGRPFQTGLAAPASLILPFPETLLGLVTTQRGLNAHGRFDLKLEEALTLKKSGVLRGPLLTQGETLLAPAPLDSLWSEVLDADKRVIGAMPHRLTLRDSLSQPHRALTSLPRGCVPALPTPALGKGKPLSGPTFWRWETLTRWLAGERPPQAELNLRSVNDATRFSEGPTRQSRFHVSLASGERRALEGHLFVTSQVDYVYAEPATTSDTARTLSLSFWFEGVEPALRSGVVHLGGESKPSYLEDSKTLIPTLPDDVADALAQQSDALERVVRVTLLTPALFSRGSIPGDHLLRSGYGERHELIGWVTGRPRAISGWDLANSAPKPHRRLAPAGSTYWLRLTEGTDPVQWARDTFMTSISDRELDRKAGFGLCVIGVT